MSTIPQIVSQQKAFFKTGVTKNIRYRKGALVRFRESIKKYQPAIEQALYQDFKKPVFESLMSETGIALRELDLAIKKMEVWVQPKHVKPALLNFPSKDSVYYEPYGTTLIISPWNYPYQLAVAPLIGAIAAGNTVILKPSELTPATSKILATIINEVFPPEYVTVVQGGIPETTTLLEQQWDYIFFTGSVPVGKIVAKAAAAHLSPVTLELGGKNPCIVDETAPIKRTAKRLVWGKFLNGGQTCIAPDYILVHHTIKIKLIDALRKEIEAAYSPNPEKSKDYARIINLKNFNRLKAMLDTEEIAHGGNTNEVALYIAPTIIDEPSLDSKVMEDEIFGPILPILSYTSKQDIERIINRYDKPLAGYVFSRRRTFKKWFIERFSFGGGVVNDTVVHFVNDRLPFGGVGTSGIGAYHGKYSFLTFSHKKSISHRSTFIDIPLRYAPYKGKETLLRWFLKNF